MEAGLRKEDSLVIKGVAILLMMFHHCFLEGRFEKYSISFAPFTAAQVSAFASFSKICVSLFAFVSGYGLYLAFSREKKIEKRITKWVLNRYLKSFFSIWFVIILIWCVSFFLSKRPVTIYFEKSKVTGVVYSVIDFLGLANLFDTPTLIGTWWYLTANIAFIVLTPILVYALKRYGVLSCIVILMLLPRCMNGFPGGTHFLTFVPPYVIGMGFAQGDWFSRIDQKLKNSKSKILAIFFSLTLTMLGYKISTVLPRKNFWDVTLGLFTAIYVITIYLSLCHMKVISQIFQFLGKHSANIFLTHGFIRSTYLSNFIYNRGHFMFVVITLLLSSLLVSFVIEFLKKLIRFENLQNYLLIHIAE